MLRGYVILSNGKYEEKDELYMMQNLRSPFETEKEAITEAEILASGDCRISIYVAKLITVSKFNRSITTRL